MGSRSRAGVVAFVAAGLVVSCDEDAQRIPGATAGAASGGTSTSPAAHAGSRTAAESSGGSGSGGDGDAGVRAGSNAAGTSPDVAGAGGASGHASAEDGGAVGNGGESAGGAPQLGGLCDEVVPSELPSCKPRLDDPDGGNECRECLKARCCDTWQSCYGTEPRGACGYGSEGDQIGQFDCMLLCFYEADRGESDRDVLFACADTCGQHCGGISGATSDLADCGYSGNDEVPGTKDDCAHVCFPLN